MRHELLQRPDFGLIKVTFDRPDESLVAESGAMVGRDTAVSMKTSLRGGMLAAAKRKLLGGESMFLNTFTAGSAGASLYLAAGPEGDVIHRRLGAGELLLAQSGCFVAAEPGIQIDTKWGGVKGFFSGAGLFLLKLTGPGDLFLAAYGGLHEIEVGAAGYICDTGHIVAFTDGLEYSIRKVGGLRGLFFSGEGLVCEFRGRGKLWVQTRNPTSLATWLHPFRRVQRRSN
jgi:uncharacterized protein (TIGR00266 family)